MLTMVKHRLIDTRTLNRTSPQPAARTIARTTRAGISRFRIRLTQLYTALEGPNDGTVGLIAICGFQYTWNEIMFFLVEWPGIIILSPLLGTKRLFRPGEVRTFGVSFRRRWCSPVVHHTSTFTTTPFQQYLCSSKNDINVILTSDRMVLALNCFFFPKSLASLSYQSKSNERRGSRCFFLLQLVPFYFH